MWRILFLLVFSNIISHARINMPPSVIRAVTEVPYPQVASVFSLSYSSFCSGTLVGPNAILTAGHCGYGEERKIVLLNKKLYLGTIYVMAASPDSTSGVQDIGLVVLDQKVTEMIPWKISTKLRAVNQYAFFSGYGWIDPWGLTAPYGVQRTGVVTLTARTQHAYVSTSDSSLSFPAPGDSGGPLFVSDHGAVAVIGVNSGQYGPVVHGRNYGGYRVLRLSL